MLLFVVIIKCAYPSLATSRACPFSAHERDDDDDKEEDPFVFSVFFVVQLSVTNFDLHNGHRKGVGEEVVEVVEVVADARRCAARLAAVVVVVPPLSNLLLREGKTAASS
jgi:hypothetical protein